jgi:alpha-1,6-mannosyltransferase
MSLVMTVPMDSLLWQRLLWPEGEVLYFNTILGKSSDWGTSPWHWYLTSALPKSMLFTILLVPLAFLRIVEILVALEQKWRRKASDLPPPLSTMSLLFDKQWLQYIVPVIGFIILYSFLGHKEMRFIFPAVPILNMAAAVGMARITQLAFPPKEKVASWMAWVAFLCGLLCIVMTFGGNLVFVAVSRWNYPGGDALLQLSESIRVISLNQKVSSLHVHVDVASAMSGVSLFAQRAAQANTPGVDWVFDKGGYEEDHSIGEGEYSQFTHLLSESRDVSPDFTVIGVVQGNPRLDLRRATVATEDSIYILEKKGYRAN